MKIFFLSNTVSNVTPANRVKSAILHLNKISPEKYK